MSMTYNELMEYNKDRQFCQMGFVTRDAEKTAREWVETLKIGPWRFVTLSDKTVSNAKVLTDGKLEEMKPFKFICAICNCGNIQFELVQPVYGNTIYNKFLEEKGEGIHHFKEKISFDDWDKIVNEYAGRGIPVTMRGAYGNNGWAYLGTEEHIDFPYELGDNLPNEVFPEGSELHFYPPLEDSEFE